MEFREIQKLLYEEYKKNGYLKMWTKVPLREDGTPQYDNDEQRIADLAEVGLFNTEISETQEALREFNYPLLYEELGEELSDILIRVINFASRKGIDLEPYLLSKHNKNLERGKRHGKII